MASLRAFWVNRILLSKEVDFHPPMQCIFRMFPRFRQISLKRSLYIKNWRRRNAFFFDFGSWWVLPKFSGTLWVPEKELKSEFNGKVTQTIIPNNFPVELWLSQVLTQTCERSAMVTYQASLKISLCITSWSQEDTPSPKPILISLARGENQLKLRPA